ncbi:alpha/beta hydrolase family protein [Pseudoalteromonas sp. MTN2-4]|uniref:alpha/beta hydrolase family protein n=1 Tax=Pseudoalteromonas sp. MTN2-4 TaxID=3056555 RepID=UPI0036F2882B
MVQEEIVFKSQTLNLKGTLSLPKSNGKFPCVVMVHGSGQQDRDGNINGFDTNIFKQLSEQLIEAGYASFCYDKRGAGKSEGDFKTAGLEEVVLDAHQAINHISTHKQVNTDAIYVLGHSEGACLAPEIANENKLISGLIMLCASLRSFEEDGIKNAEVMNRDLDALKGLKGKILRLFLYTKDPAKTMRDLRQKVESTDKPTVRVGFQKVSTKFYRETFNYDVKSHLANTIKPILAIGGEKDFQCHSDDTKLIDKVTKASTSTHIIENMDHTLRLQTGLPSLASYKNAGKNDIMPEVAIQLNDWLSGQINLIEEHVTDEKPKPTAIT